MTTPRNAHSSSNDENFKADDVYSAQLNFLEKRYKAYLDHVRSLTTGQYIAFRSLGVGATLWHQIPLVVFASLGADMIMGYRKGRRYTSIVESARISSPFVARLVMRIVAGLSIQQFLEHGLCSVLKLGPRYTDPEDHTVLFNLIRWGTGITAGAAVASRGLFGFTYQLQAQRSTILPRKFYVLRWAAFGFLLAPYATVYHEKNLMRVSRSWAHIRGA